MANDNMALIIMGVKITLGLWNNKFIGGYIIRASLRNHSGML
jgi:hypothetical protein